MSIFSYDLLIRDMIFDVDNTLYKEFITMIFDKAIFKLDTNVPTGNYFINKSH